MSIVSRIKGFGSGITGYFRTVRGELRKVQWPSKRETTIYSILVIVFTLFVSMLIWLVDTLFSTLLSFII
jgi:preprotein translocase subunit SecE